MVFKKASLDWWWDPERMYRREVRRNSGTLELRPGGQQPYKVPIINLILQIRKLKFKDPD